MVIERRALECATHLPTVEATAGGGGSIPGSASSTSRVVSVDKKSIEFNWIQDKYDEERYL